MPENGIASDDSPPPMLSSACQGCGAEMLFDPEANALKCPRCGNVAAIPAPASNGAGKEDYRRELSRLSEAAERTEQFTVTCPNCSAVVTLPDNVSAGSCAYCATPLVAASLSRRQIRPAALLPFAVTAEQAHGGYAQWLRARWFLPNAVKREFRTLPLRGCYLPFWIYDCRVQTVYTGMRGDYYYVSVTHTTEDAKGNTKTETRQERRTRWRFSAGEVRNDFHNILIPASQGASRRLLEELEPWDLEQLTPCHDDYLKGFQAEVYHTTLEEGFQHAEVRMTPRIEQRVRADIGGDEQRIHHMERTYSDIAFQHVLLPVYLSTMRYRGKNYQFVINARTGEVQGERPYSKWKIAFLVLGILAVAAVLYRIWTTA